MEDWVRAHMRVPTRLDRSTAVAIPDIHCRATRALVRICQSWLPEREGRDRSIG